MNPKVRIRVPKMQALRGGSWAKELFLTFIGATLSIILTFGTAHFVDEKQKKEDGRQTAMMVIHDMENTASLFRKYVTGEEESFNLSQYIMTNLDKIDSLRSDSVVKFVSYITSDAGMAFTYDDSSEQIFLSSQEAWKNINNPSFIDAVQAFFHQRRIIYNSLNNDLFFTKPISNDTYFDMLLKEPDLEEMDPAFLRNFIKTHIDESSVRMYINYSFVRRSYYNRYADQCLSVANKCKFMMGITDEELAQYVQNKSRTGKPIKTKQLIGNWKQLSADDFYSEREYRKDHTFVNHIAQYMSYSYYTGQITINCTIHGTWQLQGDSLISKQTDYSYDFDRSTIHYQPEMESAIDALVKSWEPTVIQFLEDAITKEDEPREAVFVSIDAMRNKIEMRAKDETIYLIRSDRP